MTVGIVGKTKKLEVVGNELIAEFVFADTENGMLAKQLYEAGFLKTSSIGFMIQERDVNDRSRITRWELLEWSLVAVPSNREALSQDRKELYEKGLAKGLLTYKDTDVFVDDKPKPKDGEEEEPVPVDEEKKATYAA